jgi:hypothetical protein
MPRRYLAFDTDLVANGIGNALVAPSPHPRHVKLWKTMRSHLASLPVVATNDPQLSLDERLCRWARA